MKTLAQINIGDTFLGGSKLFKEVESVSSLVSNIVVGAISIAGIALLFLLIAGGIGIMAGSSQQNPEAIEKGKKAATSALIGFIVVFAAYWIVKLIEAITGLSLIG